MKNFQSGHLIQQTQYKSFQPSLIDRVWVMDDMNLLQLLGQADRELGRLDMYSEYIPNIDLFIRMHVLKEATQSSKIEGTQTNMEEALLEKEDVALDKRDDWEEVQNYVAAMNEAVTKLQTLPFSARLIRETHKTLMQGVRGKHKQPGEFRHSQNWIGGASINDAIFVPPAHSSIGELIGDIEKFVHNDQQYFPELLKAALVHYQFETIHPFLDGNGRVGRLLITLYLVSRGILKQPVLYLSDFFERNRQHYYDNLMRVREKNDLLQWFKFFLVGVIETARSSTMTFDNILKLQKQVEVQLQTLGSRAANAQKVMYYLYQRPMIDAAKVGEVAGVSPASAYKLIADLERFGILKEITGGKRGKMYTFEAYLKLFR
ncbi:Fic family protein [Sideroxydans lithotrophicus]|uniref:Filamentation induced by cAMP protein Fic n=1 Tax=Sideroxydans lithotrophicus (strain ES-1) TaxID=580332 RepID=D5CMJ6_SIDLE|nr:Fic family protein [Sideroxydans lithotrophicus]ADE12668.1 filamentation induced by cAMP protein Fic [Sideroxydans lithotrophicus ES-1]